MDILNYGNGWKSAPTDNDIAKAIQAYPKPQSFPDGIMTVINFKLAENKTELQKDISFSTANQGFISRTEGQNDECKTNIGSVAKLKDHSTVYKNCHDALKFASEKLKVNFNNNIPLKIELEGNHQYDQGEVYIFQGLTA